MRENVTQGARPLAPALTSQLLITRPSSSRLPSPAAGGAGGLGEGQRGLGDSDHLRG